MAEITASTEDGREYPNWEALVEAEANGHVVVAVLTRGSSTWPWVQGPYETKEEADKARARLRTKMNREKRDAPDVSFSLFVRPAWKERRRGELHTSVSG